jgi:hypothetical protein
MSVQLDEGKISLRDNCSVEDAELLLTLLQNHPGCPVDIGDATNLHAAVLQILLAFRRELIGHARDSFLQKWIIPVLSDRTANSI